MDLTRSERLDCYLVSYGSNQAKKAPPKPSPPARKSATPKPRKSGAANTASPYASSVPRRKPGPASRTGLAASPSRATGGQLPAGWRIRDTNEGEQTFISPDGREFQVSVNDFAVIFRVLNCYRILGQISSIKIHCHCLGPRPQCGVPHRPDPAPGLEMSEDTGQHLLLLFSGRKVRPVSRL